eukprot:m.168002 g.168002  ORF g.168002 m.168002 type:complete len:71 (+) comp38945_c1_seq4:2587-2799(+)
MRCCVVLIAKTIAGRLLYCITHYTTYLTVLQSADKPSSRHHEKKADLRPNIPAILSNNNKVKLQKIRKML